jgi:membrane-associated phospholipid phosphatase
MMTTVQMFAAVFVCSAAVSGAAAQDAASDADVATPIAAAAAADPVAVPVSLASFVDSPPLTMASAAALAQVVRKPAGPPPTPEHTGIKATVREFVVDFKHLPSKENLFWVGIGSGVALAVHPADETFNSHLYGDGWNKFFAVGAVLGNTATLLGVSATVYAVGRVRDNKPVSHVGSDLLQSIGVAEVLVQSLKSATQRERPDGSGANSFPSGHAAGTFAFATALERHLGWKGAVPAYLFSSYVAMSRLHDNRHFLSDVAFGSAVGIIAGRTVTRHGRHNYSYTVVPAQGGAMLTFTRLPKG